MSPRPQLGIGEYGSLHSTEKGGVWTARARFRGVDGVVRQVSATGPTRPKAEAAFRKRIKTQKAGSVELNSESSIRDLAETWYAQRLQEDLKYLTLYAIRAALDNHIIPGIGGLRVREATTSRLDRLIQSIVTTNGPGPARKTRSALSGMFALAIRYDAVTANPALGTLLPQLGKSEVHAMTLTGFLQFRNHAVEAVRPLTLEQRRERAGGDVRRMGGLDRSGLIVDVIDFLIGTGVRASEVLGVCWEDVHLDDDVPWVMIRRQVQRQKGVGLVLVSTKEEDERRLALPKFAARMLARRKEEEPPNEWGAVFTNIRGNLVDQVCFRRVWHAVFDGSEWGWVTQKTLRKTVATIIAAEQGSKLAAKQLGHASDAVTLKHYIEPSHTPVDQRLTLDLFGA